MISVEYTSTVGTYPSKLERLRSQAKGFVVLNLNAFGNSLVPDGVIDQLGVPTTERLLSVIIGDTVKVYKGEAGFWIAKR